MHESRWWEIIDKEQSDIYNNFNNLAELYGNRNKPINN
jgi:hypothetical protein